MSGFRENIRAAALALMEGYKAANPDTLRQVYDARPASIYPPTGFVDAINEGSILYTQGPIIRNPVVDVIFIAGIFDSAEAAHQQDALVDGFIAHVRANYSAAGVGTLVTIARVEDIPNYEPDWLMSPRADNPAIYYATRFALEGLKASGTLI